MLIKWPGVIAPGAVCTTPVTSPDFFPTLLEIAGQPLRPDLHCDGVSFAGLLRGEQELPREAIFWHYPHYGNQGGTPGSSLRAGDFKLIEFFEDGRLELYNLRLDIGDMIAPCMAMTGKGGTMVVTSIANMMAADVQLSLFDLAMMNKQIKGTIFGSGNPRSDIPNLLSMYREGTLKLDELITTRYTLDQINQGYADMNAGKNIRGVIEF